jgi:hypothetical protein
MIAMKRQLALVVLFFSLVASPLLAQGRGGDDDHKPVNDTATIHYVCNAEGVQRISDSYSQSSYTDEGPRIKYILPIEGARARGEWLEVDRLAKMSMEAAPKCYTAYFSHAQALMHACKLEDAKSALQIFIEKAKDQPAYDRQRLLAQNAVETLDSGRDPTGCSTPKK